MRLYLAFTTSAAVVVLLLALSGSQSATSSPQFEAISIKALPAGFKSDGVGLYWVGLRDPSQWQAQGQPLLFIVMAAYGLGQWERSRLIGLPSWGYSEFYEINARVPPHATNAQVPLMVRAMLADRFHLKAHWAKRELPAVAMTVAPGGAKMQRDVACDNSRRAPSGNMFHFQGGIRTRIAPAQSGLACGTWSRSQTDSTQTSTFHGITMAQLASLYSGSGGRALLVDRTGLQGAFDFTLNLPDLGPPGRTAEEMQSFRRDAERELIVSSGSNSA